MKAARCPHCDDQALSALADAVVADDIDRAIALGLLDVAPPIAACTGCTTRIEKIVQARDARLRALAARERYRARQIRLAERAESRARRRAASVATVATASIAAAPTLPGAAAAALARAKAKAAAGKAD